MNFWCGLPSGEEKVPTEVAHSNFFSIRKKPFFSTTYYTFLCPFYIHLVDRIRHARPSFPPQFPLYTAILLFTHTHKKKELGKRETPIFQRRFVMGTKNFTFFSIDHIVKKKESWRFVMVVEANLSFSQYIVFAHVLLWLPGTGSWVGKVEEIVHPVNVQSDAVWMVGVFQFLISTRPRFCIVSSCFDCCVTIQIHSANRKRATQNNFHFNSFKNCFFFFIFVMPRDTID